MGWAPRVAAKLAGKIDKALYECASCSVYVYEGKSPTTFEYYKEVYPHVIMENPFLDHIEPVVPIEGLGHFSDYNWNIHYKRLFCPQSNFQILCHGCHSAKSSAENKQRKLHKGKKK